MVKYLSMALFSILLVSTSAHSGTVKEMTISEFKKQPVCAKESTGFFSSVEGRVLPNDTVILGAMVKPLETANIIHFGEASLVNAITNSWTVNTLSNKRDVPVEIYSLKNPAQVRMFKECMSQTINNRQREGNCVNFARAGITVNNGEKEQWRNSTTKRRMFVVGHTSGFIMTSVGHAACLAIFKTDKK